MGFAGGRIDPGRPTITKLLELVRQILGGKLPAPPLPAPVPPLPVPVPGGSLRSRIIQIAMAEATPAPGKVSDQVTRLDGGQVVRQGWQQLFLLLQEKQEEVHAEAIELDSKDRHIISLLAGGASECIHIPIIYPVYRRGAYTFPMFNLNKNTVFIHPEAVLVGYMRLESAIPVPSMWVEA